MEVGSSRAAATDRILLELARLRNGDLQSFNQDLQNDNTRLRQQNAQLNDELAGARLMLEEVIADAAAARRAAARATAAPLPPPPTVPPPSRSSRSAIANLPAASSRAVAGRTREGERQRPAAVAARPSAAPAAAAAAERARRRQQQQKDEAAARNAWRAERTAAVLVLQRQVRRLLWQQRLCTEQLETSAAMRLQAVVRGNSARGIVERRRFEAPSPESAGRQRRRDGGCQGASPSSRPSRAAPRRVWYNE